MKNHYTLFCAIVLAVFASGCFDDLGGDGKYYENSWYSEDGLYLRVFTPGRQVHDSIQLDLGHCADKDVIANCDNINFGIEQSRNTDRLIFHTTYMNDGVIRFNAKFTKGLEENYLCYGYDNPELTSDVDAVLDGKHLVVERVPYDTGCSAGVQLD